MAVDGVLQQSLLLKLVCVNLQGGQESSAAITYTFGRSDAGRHCEDTWAQRRTVFLAHQCNVLGIYRPLCNLNRCVECALCTSDGCADKCKTFVGTFARPHLWGND